MAPTQPVDIGSAIEALAGGAGSIIHQTMLRKQGEYERTRQATIDKQSQDRYQQQIDLQKQTESDRKNERTQDLARQDAKERREFLMAGGVPAHTEQQPTLTAQPSGTAPITPLDPIRQAMGVSQQRPDLISALGGPQLTPSNAPDSGSPIAPPTSATVNAPVAGSKSVNVPESYDPTQSANYIRAAMLGDLKQKGILTKEEWEGQRAKDHDDRVTARIQSGEKPIMVRGNPFWENADKTLEPARYSDGRPVTVENVPQAPPAPPRALSSETIRNAQLHAMDTAISQTQHDLKAAQSIAQAAPGRAKPADKQAASAKMKDLQARLDMLTQKRDSTANVQQTTPDAPASAPPAPRRLGAKTTAPTAAAASSAAKSAITKAEHDELLKNGFTEAQIAAKYAVTP